MSSTNHHHNKPAALQDRCSVNLDAFHNGRCKAQWLHVDPPVLTVDNFFTEQECDDIRRITISPPPAGVVRVIKLKSRLSESKSNQMGRAAWSRFALLRGGKSGTATRALGAVSAIPFGWKVLYIIDMVPTYKVALQ